MPETTVFVEPYAGPTPAEARIEIVERKGLGHPDTICDSVMEHVSQALSKAYRERFGRILHHNCDKGLLVAGQAEHRFGGGRIIEPMRLVIGDRATQAPGLDVAQIAVTAAKGWFRENLPLIDADRHLLYQVELKPGSEQLTGIFSEAATVALANDTSAAVGYAPLTETEQLVLSAERFLNGADFKRRFPAGGQDVKIMAVRNGDRLALTAAMPLLDRYVDNETSYFQQKEAVRVVLIDHLREKSFSLREIAVDLNSLDRPGRGLAGLYVTVLGTSAEDADSGEVGRGNQVNGLIALNRPRGSEAAAGKNPVSHVGKIYSALTHLLAERIYREVAGLEQAVVWLCSRIGAPIDAPQTAAVQVKLKSGVRFAEVDAAVQAIVRQQLAQMPSFCRRLAEGEYAVS